MMVLISHEKYFSRPTLLKHGRPLVTMIVGCQNMKLRTKKFNLSGPMTIPNVHQKIVGARPARLAQKYSKIGSTWRLVSKLR